MAATLAQLAQAAPDPNASYTYRILNAPSSGDERGIRNLALQPKAQQLSDKLFTSLSSLLGGSAPGLNFVPTGSQFAPNSFAANLSDRTGAPQGTINVDPLAVEGLINNTSAYHSPAVNAMPHEMMHLRQQPSVLASLMQSEGGAQAFADLVTPEAAHRANIPFQNGNFDGSYAPYVQSVQQAPYGRDWILGGQMGKTAPPTFP